MRHFFLKVRPSLLSQVEDRKLVLLDNIGNNLVVAVPKKLEEPAPRQ